MLFISRMATSQFFLFKTVVRYARPLFGTAGLPLTAPCQPGGSISNIFFIFQPVPVIVAQINVFVKICCKFSIDILICQAEKKFFFVIFFGVVESFGVTNNKEFKRIKDVADDCKTVVHIWLTG